MMRTPTKRVVKPPTRYREYVSSQENPSMVNLSPVQEKTKTSLSYASPPFSSPWRAPKVGVENSNSDFSNDFPPLQSSKSPLPAPLPPRRITTPERSSDLNTTVGDVEESQFNPKFSNGPPEAESILRSPLGSLVPAVPGKNGINWYCNLCFC